RADPTPEANPGPEPRPEAGTETRPEAGPETGAEALIAGVVAEVLAEFPSGLAPDVMHGTPLCGIGIGIGTGAEAESGAESGAQATGEWSVGGSEWIAHFL